MGNKINKSIVAQGGSSISNVSNKSSDVNVAKIRTVSGIVGFVLGVVSSVVGSYLYETFISGSL